MKQKKPLNFILVLLRSPRLYLLMGVLITLTLSSQHPAFFILGFAVILLSLALWIAKPMFNSIGKEDFRLEEDFIP